MKSAFFICVKEKIFGEKKREPTLSEYRAFLMNIDKFRFLNDTYDNLKRLGKKEFFVLHHEVHREIDAIMDFAKVEHELGWRSTFFLPAENLEGKHPPLKKLQMWKHDVGLLYDCLETCRRDYGAEDRDLFQRAWMRFENTLRRHNALMISVMDAYNLENGADNRSLWKSFDYRSMQIRCDAVLDFCQDYTIVFTVGEGRVSYQRRDYYGNYQDVKARKIRSLRDLGRRLKRGKLMPRMVVKIVWR